MCILAPRPKMSGELEQIVAAKTPSARAMPDFFFLLSLSPSTPLFLCRKKKTQGRRQAPPGPAPAASAPSASRHPCPNIDVGLRCPGQAVASAPRRRQGEERGGVVFFCFDVEFFFFLRTTAGQEQLDMWEALSFELVPFTLSIGI